MAIKTNTVAYTNEQPWRGLGVNVPKDASVKQMMKAASVDFNVMKWPLAYINKDAENKLFPGHYALTHSKTGQVFDVCGERYIPTQPSDAMGFFDDLVTKGEGHIEYMGGLMDNRIVWALASLDEEFKLPGKDNLRPYLFLASPSIQGKSLIARLTLLRDVCNNTLSIALRKGRNGVGDTFRMNHRNQFDEVQRGHARKVLGIARDQAADFAKTAKQLSAKKVTTDQAHDTFSRLFNAEATSPRVKAIIDAYTNAPGAQPGSAWGIVNAVTYWTDHLAGNSDDRRLTNAWIGRNSNKKLDALELVQAL